MKLTTSEKNRFNSIYTHEMSVEFYEEHYSRSRHIPENLLKKVLDKHVSRGVEQVEEGRYQISPKKVITNFQKDYNRNHFSKVLLKGLAGCAYHQDAISGAQFKEVVKTLETSDAEVFAELLAKTLLGETVNEKELLSAIETYSKVRVYSFSSFSENSPSISSTSKTLARYAETLRSEFSTYNFFLSWRPADVTMMSYGLSESCYSSGGLFSHAPFVLTKIPEVFVGYTTNKDREEDSFLMRRSRFFGYANNETILNGRLYKRSGIKFLMDLLVMEQACGLSSWGGQETMEMYEKKLGKENVDLEEVSPNSGYTYTDDMLSKTVNAYIAKSLGGLYNEAKQALEIASLFDGPKAPKQQAEYICPDCQSVSSYSREDYLDQENTLSCCGTASYCECCEDRMYDEESTYVEDYGNVCHDCIEHRSFEECSHCSNTYYTRSVNFYDVEGNSVCAYCIDEYPQCSECHEYVFDDHSTEDTDGNVLCLDCHEKLEGDAE